MSRGVCRGCGVAGHYQTTCPQNPTADPRRGRKHPPKPDPAAEKIVRLGVVLAEASALIDELRGGEPARRFRGWVEWYERRMSLLGSRTRRGAGG